MKTGLLGRAGGGTNRTPIAPAEVDPGGGKAVQVRSQDVGLAICLPFGLTILTNESSRLDETFVSFILAMIYLISILIYEGSSLLLLPMLTLTKGRMSRIITIASIGVGAALIWQFSGAESSETGSLITSSYSGFNPITGNSIKYIHSQNSFFPNFKK